MNRDGNNESIWQQRNDYVPQAYAPGNNTVDVLVIGGGITGVSTALALQKAGKKCILAEAETLGFGTTGGTTAHLNNFFDSPYDMVGRNFGKEQATLLARGAREALDRITANVQEYTIDCGYETKDAYLFALNHEQSARLEEIVIATREAGVSTGYVDHSPFPIPYLRIARIGGQAQFNPISYIFALAQAFEAAGGAILQHCRAQEISEEEESCTAHTSLGTIRAHRIVYATHIPPGVNILHFQCAPYRSYAIAVKLKNDQYPDALGYDMCDPYRYYRTQTINGETYLIAGGEDHKTGHEENTNAPLRRLESDVRSYFEVDSVAFKWSSQYYEPSDGLPFIGQLPGHGSNVYTATGFGGNGMIYGTLAAQILTDLILGGESPYSKLFNPSRIKPMAEFKNVVRETADVVKEFIKGKLPAETLDSINGIASGEGKIVQHEGEKIALYRDGQHAFHALNPTCTHVYCTVGWNETEQSWDCPCHGARYSIDGKVLNGPAGKDLDKVILKDF